MKILFVLKQYHFVRPFTRTLRYLAARGHQIRVCWHGQEPPASDRSFDDLREVPGISLAMVPGHRSEARKEVAIARRAWNYLRYLEPKYRGALKLRARSFDKLLRLFMEQPSNAETHWANAGLHLTEREVRRLMDFFAYVEDLIPTDPECDAFLEAEAPDLLLVTPLVDLNSSVQADFVKSAKKRGIPTGLLVYSWDNLSTKGGLHVMPDRLFVWNRTQRDEAATLHRVKRSTVSLTGAPRFDAFLECRPKVKHTTFCQALGLEETRPIVLYLCSSEFVSGREMPFVQSWIRALRSAPDPRVREASVVVRPHPDIALVDRTFPAEKVVWPGVEDVVGAVRRPFDDPHAVVFNTTSMTPQGLYECLSHSVAVVGLNTSAEIEAGLLGLPVLTIRAEPEHADGQQGTLHFHYLLKAHGGFVEAADTLEEHVAQLGTVLDPAWDGRKDIVTRAREFVRPIKAKVPASVTLAHAIEREFAPFIVRGDHVL